MIDRFEDILGQIKAIYDKKKADYSASDDPYSNFRQSGDQIGVSPGFACEVLIATKQARLKELIGNGKQPQNESVADTLLDRAVYSILAMCMFSDGLYQEGTRDG